MLYGFATENEAKAKAAYLVYAIYRSRDPERGPSGVDMWGQIERFVKASAKRALTIDDFVDAFKRRMKCSTINPVKISGLATNARVNPETGEIIVLAGLENQRDFGIEILELPEEEASAVLDCLYTKTQIIILLVRDRLERERELEQE